MDDRILNQENRKASEAIFQDAIRIGLDFKLKDKIRDKEIDEAKSREIMLAPLPLESQKVTDVLDEFVNEIMPYSYNFASPTFMGFPDAGNSVGAITGSILSDFLQQNLINQSFCSPSGTFVEMAVLNWLRQVVGYNAVEPEDVFGAGGIVTTGGTSSNGIAMMLARENLRSHTMKNGVEGDYYLIVPEGIGHYSVKSAQMWLGCGNKLLEVPTVDFRYDLKALEETLVKYKGSIMAVVAYAGDSRTMTVDHLDDIVKIRDAIDPNIWLHADAAHGFSLGFSQTLRKKIAGIEKFDSITTDPHKVMNIPYTISALLVKDPQSMTMIASQSDLIMKERYAFGQVTPFIGSKSWLSLKLWFAMKSIGINGYGKIIDDRHALALELQKLIEDAPDFMSLNRVDINSVVFMYTGKSLERSIQKLNKVNEAIHDRIVAEGVFHVHQFTIPDSGFIKKGAVLQPMRYMNGNPNTNVKHLKALLTYIRQIAQEVEGE